MAYIHTYTRLSTSLPQMKILGAPVFVIVVAIVVMVVVVILVLVVVVVVVLFAVSVVVAGCHMERLRFYVLVSNRLYQLFVAEYDKLMVVLLRKTFPALWSLPLALSLSELTLILTPCILLTYSLHGAESFLRS
jgi:hypothetical protein